LPTFINVNNTNIRTAVPPAVRGIGGNLFFDAASGEEVMMVAQFGDGFRVIQSITDSYVAHHGALGLIAQVHLPRGMDAAKVRDWLLARAGITECHERIVGARLMELQEDRLGDLVVASERNVVLGLTPAYHDLTALAGGLRSHGGRYEEMVPLVFSEPLNSASATRAAGDARNSDIFEFTCNGTH
jgi:phosphonoacetate hydrolase